MHLPILRRAGIALLAIGIVDIGVMIYCVVNKISYSSSFNIFAVIAGIFLMRGSLKAAGIVRWWAVFLGVGFGILILVAPLLQPFDLTMTRLRIHPLGFVFTVLFVLALVVFLYWLQKELGNGNVVEAIKASGRKVRDMRVPAFLGCGVVLLVGAITFFSLGGETSSRAVALAKEKLGDGYSYHVSALRKTATVHQRKTLAEVTAWSRTEIRSIVVEWSE